MIELFNNNILLGYVDDYYNRLSRVGYVKDKTTLNYVLYLFLVDFVDTMYVYISEDDYKKLEKAISKIFFEHDCLLSYKTFSSVRAKIAGPYYMGNGNMRIDESDNVPKSGEMKEIRGV